MKNNASLVFALFLVVGDFLALILAFLAAYILRFKVLDPELATNLSGKNFAYAILGTLPLWILVHALIGLYSHNIYNRRFAEFGRLFIGSILGILTVIGYDFFTNAELFPGRLVPLYGLLLGFGFLVIFRAFARLLRYALFRVGFGISNVLIIGNTTATDDIVSSIRNTKTTGQQVLGIIGKELPGFNHYKSLTDAIERLRRPIHSIIQTELYGDQAKNNEILKYAQENHVSYRFVPGNTDLFVGNIAVELFAGRLPVIAVHQTALTGWGRIVKRLFDLIVATLILIIISPVMLILAAIIKLSDGGPVFLRQVRLTRFNREFRVFKFRSHNQTYNGLTPDEAFAKMGRPDLLEEFRRNGNFLVNDPRETRIGRFIRKASLDELPQLFNVIIGDLSLVGPRALIPKDLAEYKKRHTILSVKSGITGLAQVSGRNNIPVEERRRLDLYYAQNWSFWLDIIILLKTARAIVAHEDNDKPTRHD